LVNLRDYPLKMSGVSQKEFSMKNNKILLAILAIALVLGMTTACSDGGGGGSGKSGTTGNTGNTGNTGGGSGGLTITGIPAEYKRISVMGDTDDDVIFFSNKSGINVIAYETEQISGGTVTIHAWVLTNSASVKKYTGSDNVEMIIELFTDGGSSVMASHTVKFQNGNASISYSSIVGWV
jgi:hypothetical protein